MYGWTSDIVGEIGKQIEEKCLIKWRHWKQINKWRKK